MEFTELLCVLARLVSLEADQAQLLGEVVNAPLLSRDDLEAAGVTWPPPGFAVKPPRR